jgi:hypothetical protein
VFGGDKQVKQTKPHTKQAKMGWVSAGPIPISGGAGPGINSRAIKKRVVFTRAKTIYPDKTVLVDRLGSASFLQLQHVLHKMVLLCIYVILGHHFAKRGAQ